jgi:photosystem II stability/assembly factor-like uncharacterized protein
VVLLAFAAGIVWGAPHFFSTSESLSVVAFPDSQHAWVGGDVWTNGGTLIAGGTIDATTSGGASWHRQEYATDWSDPSGVAFANAKCGWVVGNTQAVGDTMPNQDSLILATTDGGVTWKQQACRTKDILSGVACVSASQAWAVGCLPGGVIFATTDGGIHWRQEYASKTADFQAVAFANAQDGWAVGDGDIVGTTDGGRTWRRQGPVGGCFLQSVACAGARCAWAVGSSPSNRDVILATTDGGATWRVQYTGSGPDSQGAIGYSGVAFADPLHGWAVGFAGAIVATSNGGRTWRPQRSGTKLDLYDVAFVNARDGLVVGYYVEGNDPMAGKLDGSVILRTTNGGASWTH